MKRENEGDLYGACSNPTSVVLGTIHVILTIVTFIYPVNVQNKNFNKYNNKKKQGCLVLRALKLIGA